MDEANKKRLPQVDYIPLPQREFLGSYQHCSVVASGMLVQLPAEPQSFNKTGKWSLCE